MTDRVVMVNGRAGRLIESLPRGYRVQFISADTYKDETVSDADVLEIQYDWPGYVSELEESAAQIYVMKAQSPRYMTPEWWESIVHRFPGSARHCMFTAEQILAGDELN